MIATNPHLSVDIVENGVIVTVFTETGPKTHVFTTDVQFNGFMSGWYQGIQPVTAKLDKPKAQVAKAKDHSDPSNT